MIFARHSLGHLLISTPSKPFTLQNWLRGRVNSMASLARQGGRLQRQNVASASPRRLVARTTSPTLDIATAMPLSCREMDNSSLITLSTMKNHDACVEVLKRHIMSVDKASYDQAEQTFFSIAAVNSQGMLLQTIPYKLGITAALTAGLGSIPLCFHLPTIHWFNREYVTTDVPEPADLETWLEVGSWAWNWMEPPLGQISFFLLCLQYSRAQLENLGIRPYTTAMKHRRAKRLATAFPMYDTKVIMNFSSTAGYYHTHTQVPPMEETKRRKTMV